MPKTYGHVYGVTCGLHSQSTCNLGQILLIKSQVIQIQLNLDLTSEKNQLYITLSFWFFNKSYDAMHET